VGEVREREVVDQGLGVGRHLGVGVAGGQFGDDTGGGGADVVHVEFGLGQPGDEVVQVARDGAGGHGGRDARVAVVGHGFLPGNGALPSFGGRG
jgi:hypothetical protein